MSLQLKLKQPPQPLPEETPKESVPESSPIQTSPVEKTSPVDEAGVDSTENASNLQYQIEDTLSEEPTLGESDEDVDFDQDPTLDELNEDDSNQEPDGSFNPSQSDYIIRQSQIANFQILSQFFAHEDKNITETLKDIRVSIDGLSKCVLHLNNTIEKLASASSMAASSTTKKSAKSN